jgi:tripartite-type tricarboxylate transporter receptor subunit TctC
MSTKRQPIRSNAKRLPLSAPVIGSLLLMALSFGVAVPAAFAQAGLAGKTIELHVANTVGGGYDQYARTIARHISKHIPGNPAIIIKNVPGAGGARAANFLFNVAPRDGTTIAMLTREIPYGPLLTPNPEAYKFKAEEFNWIGSPQQDLGLMLIRTRAAKTLDDLKSREVQMSGMGPATLSAMFPLMLNQMLGTQFKIVNGYPGSVESVMAVERGEVEGHASSGSSAAFRARIQPMIDRGELQVLMQLGMQKDPAYTAPLVFELVSNPSDRQLLELLFAPQYAGRPLVAPPGLAADLVASFRSAFDATMKDPDFIKDAQTQKLELNPVTGQQIADKLSQVYKLPAELVRKVSAMSKQ